MAEPTLVILGKRSSESRGEEFFVDVALVKAQTNYGTESHTFAWKDQKVEFDLRLRQTFSSTKITDIDCQNISKK